MENIFKKQLLATFAAVLILFLFGGCGSGGTAVTVGNSSNAPDKELQTNVFRDIASTDAKALIDSNSELNIIDVRMPDEYASGHLANAINIDVKAVDFREKISVLDKNKSYLVYCRTGKRSLQAIGTMKELGFTNVNNLLGGIVQWQADGGATVK